MPPRVATMTDTGSVVFEVLLFSVLREKVGLASVVVSVSGPATGVDLLDALVAAHPVIEAYRPVLRLAVNQTYVPESASLSEGDEIALITPVSGG